MTEPHAGEPGEFICGAVQDGDDWVINGEKWFTSNGAAADFLIVMAVTSPDKPLLERASMFIVDRDTPGVEIVRNVHTLGTPLKENYNVTGGGGHAYIRYDNVRVPRDALLGEEGAGFVGSQTRLSGGRVHHAMRAVGVCAKALDMMCERALSRKAKGEWLSDLQMVQQDIADSYIQLKQFRLHVLYTAWLIDKTKAYTREVRKEIASIKISAAKVNHDIIYRAIHLHGALGMSNETPLGEMWMAAPQMGIMDGTTEVHKANLAKLLLRDYDACEDLFPTYHLPKLILKAQDKFEKVIEKFAAG
jgi:acyl-CoA dehydrogenase